MDIIDGLKSFVATAQTGSFTGAAEQLGISNRLTSKYVAELEQRLGVRLFQRTTRRVGLTPAGEELLARAPGLLYEFDDMLSDLSEGARRVSGTVRISAPLTFGESYVTQMLGRFAQAHPEISVHLRLDDKYVDLASDGIDLAFRIGTTDTLTMKFRKLGEIQSVLVASPEYLKKYSAPVAPQDVSQHNCIIDTNRRNPRRWSMYEADNEISVPVSGRFFVNSARAAREIAVAGMGIAYIPRFAIGDDLADGRLVQVLEAFTGESNPISAIYLEGRRLPHKISTLIDFAVKDIRASQVL